jgi:hypothetical protein
MRINVYDGTGGRDGKVTPSLLQRVINRLTHTLLNVRAVFTGVVDFTNATVIGIGGGGGTGTVQSIQGDFIDNTDPDNPVIIGVENVLKQCKNDTGVLIPKGTPVKVVGVQGELPKIEIATASNTHVPSGAGTNEIFGVAFEDIGGSAAGPVLIYGSVENVNTLAYEVGDFLYVSPTGTLVNTPPAVPYERICIGLVIKKNATEGVICVRTSQPVHANDIVGFNLASLQGGDVINYDLSTNSFKNVSLTSLGYTTGTGSSGRFTTWAGNSSLTSIASRTNANSFYIGSNITSISTAVNNVSFGFEALNSLTTGSNNVAVGYFSGRNMSTGASNTALGRSAMQNVSSGTSNVAVGFESGLSLTTAGNNVAVGTGALRTLTTVGNLVAVGFEALRNNTTGAQNTALGSGVLRNNTTGTNNVAVGFFALNANTTGGNNTAFGSESLSTNTGGSNNTSFGANSLKSNTTSNNTVVGFDAARLNTSGTRITAVGTEALRANTTANDNTALGYRALYVNTTGNNNTAVGASTLATNTIGYGNVAVGFESLKSLTEGIYNVAIGGGFVLSSSTTAERNIGIGYAALSSITTGDGNIGIGTSAGSDLASDSDSSIIIGNEIETDGGLTNYLLIGNLIYGKNTSSFYGTASNGSVGIGDNDPVSRLSVRSANITSATNAMTVYNGAAANLFNIRDDGRVTVNNERVVTEATNTGSPISKLWTGTQAQYDALPTYNAETLYIIA